MGIQYFYNFCITKADDTDLESDILSAVRRCYFASFEKIRDKITYDSEGASMLYDYCIEKNKPLRWTVKAPDGALTQEVMTSDSGRYYLCFYRGGKLFKRLLFSKLHTLLKAEYTDGSGAVCSSIEPRKAPGGLCLLYVDSECEQPTVLSATPAVSDSRVKDRLLAEFTDFTAAASTDEGVTWFLSDEQTAHFRSFVNNVESELSREDNESFIGENAPLFERINEKDFNIKRNLSAALDITMAKEFGLSAPEEEPEEDNVEIQEATEEIAEQQELDSVISAEEAAETADEAPTTSEDEISAEELSDEPVPAAEEETSPVKPDKLIMADGAVYSYYGELDENNNRSGYGRTLTDLGRTAYEGMYRGDKRSGKGAYFYKDGTLCYSGDWSENVRHGVGVGISAKDGSMHIGRWVNNKPEGNGVRLTAQGDIKFVCKELSGGGTALMNYLDDDTVVISNYDKDGNKISEKTISLN